MYMASQVYPKDSMGMYKAYLDGTQEAHGYLIFDLSQETNDGLNFRPNVFPTGYLHIVVYSDIGDEACEK